MNLSTTERENLTSQTGLLPAQQEALTTLSTAHALVNKSYLAELKHYDVLPVENQQSVPLNRGGDVRIFRVERLVQENKQSVLESTTAAYTALGAAGYTAFLFLKSDGKETLLYIGTRGEPGKMLGQNSGDLLQETFKGHFPGSKLSPLNGIDVDALLDELSAGNAYKTVTAVSSVPGLSTEDQTHFMQGLERFIDAAENRTYEGLILAEPVSMQALNTVRTGYEQVATQLSALSNRQYSYGIQDSDAINLSISEGLSHSLGESLGLTETTGTSESTTTSVSRSHTTNESKSSPNKKDKIIGMGAMALGSAAGIFAGPLGVMIGGQVGGQVASMFQTTDTVGSSESTSTSESSSHSTNQSTATSTTTTETDTHSTTNTKGLTQTHGSTQQVSFETADKGILNMLEKVDHHLNRINEAKSHGGWLSTAYFVSDSAASSEALSSIFLGLTRGTQSSMEDFALTTWAGKKANAITQWLGQLMHPRLEPSFAGNTHIPYLTPATLVSSKEMALQLSLPRRSTSTVVVQETAAFGRKVQTLNADVANTNSRTISLGQVRHLWTDLSQTVELDLDQLTSHTLITGSTGSGKSNTVYALLDQAVQQDIPFLVIEPAKGEYKHVFGNRADVRVLGTNDRFTELLKINPFSFPEQTHVLEHVDRLIEVFNVCWPMYAAMPAILKDAMLRSYEACAWDLRDSTSTLSSPLFPTFADLLMQLESVIAQSAYSDEMKSNYTGALVTRVRSMVNGLNGQIFASDEISNADLFDRNVIIDLSRVGSQETKSLLMGLLIIRLGEYRAEQMLMNQPLKHITVLEEAHNILRANPSTGGTEGGSLAEKSVEMLSNAIAEMRTYGEGFIIADQSPSAVHITAIRNTNTKILMRLPDEADRLLAGKSAALTEEQIDEMARLPRGVAVVYQNEWLEAVLCKVSRFSGQESHYQYQSVPTNAMSEMSLRFNLVTHLLSGYNQVKSETNEEQLAEALFRSNLQTAMKVRLIQYLRTGISDLFFCDFAFLVPHILDCNHLLESVICEAKNVEQVHSCLQMLVLDKFNNASQEQVVMIIQPLLRSLVPNGEIYKKLYSEWKQFAKRKVA
ncbi:ATP-binding protein [Vibrio diabolicus]|uniref:ATP-binding protein n=1 Tax=Vibrio diabolicus TaxID=50719 RepID=UPI00211B5138|nr:ATP-binding protein [Vibrio diabolicus]MCE3221349.1 ATP-binding protein [Vibrio diabolicus]MCG9228495.1 ATP-binding protein [Vibrio diabolicus]MCG9573118.1 ATP-binding protein [Vibrio diabolicus]MCG9592771.1 ATP-binding protein [Vibrio diabolicus]MCG9772322.1 ATP-binding protein [Vibrio diabolicus]